MIHIESTAPTVTASIRLSGTDLVSTMAHNVYHNSFYISATGTISGQSPLTGTASSPTGGVHGIGTSRASTTPSIDSKNNIVRVSVPGGAALLRMAATGTYSSNNNILSAATNIGAIGTAPAVTLPDWQATVETPDLSSAVVNPLVTTGSAWSPSGNSADLHFIPAATKPAELVGMPSIGVLKDIDGETRNTGGTAKVYPGADEGLVAVPVTLSGFEIE